MKRAPIDVARHVEPFNTSHYIASPLIFQANCATRSFFPSIDRSLALQKQSPNSPIPDPSPTVYQGTLRKNRTWQQQI